MAEVGVRELKALGMGGKPFGMQPRVKWRGGATVAQAIIENRR